MATDVIEILEGIEETILLNRINHHLQEFSKEYWISKNGVRYFAEDNLDSILEKIKEGDYHAIVNDNFEKNKKQIHFKFKDSSLHLSIEKDLVKYRHEQGVVWDLSIHCDDVFERVFGKSEISLIVQLQKKEEYRPLNFNHNNLYLGLFDGFGNHELSEIETIIISMMCNSVLSEVLNKEEINRVHIINAPNFLNNKIKGEALLNVLRENKEFDFIAEQHNFNEHVLNHIPTSKTMTILTKEQAMTAIFNEDIMSEARVVEAREMYKGVLSIVRELFDDLNHFTFKKEYGVKDTEVEFLKNYFWVAGSRGNFTRINLSFYGVPFQLVFNVRGIEVIFENELDIPNIEDALVTEFSLKKVEEIILSALSNNKLKLTVERPKDIISNSLIHYRTLRSDDKLIYEQEEYEFIGQVHPQVKDGDIIWFNHFTKTLPEKQKLFIDGLKHIHKNMTDFKNGTKRLSGFYRSLDKTNWIFVNTCDEKPNIIKVDNPQSEIRWI